MDPLSQMWHNIVSLTFSLLHLFTRFLLLYFAYRFVPPSLPLNEHQWSKERSRIERKRVTPEKIDLLAASSRSYRADKLVILIAIRSGPAPWNQTKTVSDIVFDARSRFILPRPLCLPQLCHHSS